MRLFIKINGEEKKLSLKAKTRIQAYEKVGSTKYFHHKKSGLTLNVNDIYAKPSVCKCLPLVLSLGFSLCVCSIIPETWHSITIPTALLIGGGIGLFWMSREFKQTKNFNNYVI